MYIDPHVHCRDGAQAHKETIAHALRVAEKAGMTAIFDMPNTSPPVMWKKDAKDRIELAEKARSPVFYGLYMAITSDEKQIEEAVQTYKEAPQVVGFKLYAGHSVGNIGVVSEESQQKIYEMLRRLDYRGVLAVHCEKESLMNDKAFDSANPVTHAVSARPPDAEVASVKDQINFAKKAGFAGVLHIAHISVPESVFLVADARASGMQVTCGVTPHHIVFDYTRMQGKNGLLYKMNPPLRPPGMNAKMLSLLKEGKIDWIESDHAPHTLAEKLEKPWMSGLPGLPFYPKLVDMLKNSGFTPDQVKKITFSNILQAFCRDKGGLQLEQRNAVPDWSGLEKEYQFDPYHDVWERNNLTSR